MLCLVCGNDTENCICDECAKTTDIEKLCYDITEYNVESFENKIFEIVYLQCKYKKIYFKDFVFDLAKRLETPKKELIIIRNLANRTKYSFAIPTDKKELFLENYSECIEHLSKDERNEVDGYMLALLYRNYEWKKADDIAEKISQNNNLPLNTYYSLIEFYTRTRRYDKAKEFIDKAAESYPERNAEITEFCEDYEGRSSGRKKAYCPQNMKTEYIDFLTSIGIDPGTKSQSPLSTAARNRANRISNSDYPSTEFVHTPDFTSFVAYDLETTGFGGYDCITEIGAFRVVDMKIVESEQFKFQELVHRYGGAPRIPLIVEQLTGITNEMVDNADTIENVFNRFADFVGDDILVGFNNHSFDARFLRRAGRYANRTLTNKQFDLMPYASCYASEHGIQSKTGRIKLSAVADMFGIVNEQAHRAYSDALTTAKAFIKIFEK